MSSSSSSLCILGSSSSRDDPINELEINGGDSDEDADDGALSRSAAERILSSFESQGPLDAVCREYGIPEEYTAVLPAAGYQRACSPPPPGAICVYAHALEAGMRVPLHHFFCELLAHFGIAPGQIVPNGWRLMAGFVVLSHFAGVQPSLAVFRHLFTLCAFKRRGKGWYFFRGKDAGGALFKGKPPSRGWKDGFFFLKSPLPLPWPCPVMWGEPSKSSTAEPVLTRDQQRVAKKLLRLHGTQVDINTYLSERNIAAAVISGSATKKEPPPPPSPSPLPSPRSASAKGMDASVYDMMQKLRAAKAQATVKSEPEPGSSDTPPSSVKKRKLTEDAGPSRLGPSTPIDRAHGSLSGVCSPSSPGFSPQKPSKINMSGGLLPGAGGDTADWEAARQMLQSIVSPAVKETVSAAKPSDVLASSYIAALQAANYASFSLGYALELEEKLAAREREADALRQELAQAKAELAGAKAAAAEEARSAAEKAVLEFRGSTELVLRFAEHALAGHEQGMEDMKKAVLRRYPHLDPEQLVVPADGGRSQ